MKQHKQGCARVLGFQELRAHRNFLLEETPTTRTSLESSRQDEAIKQCSTGEKALVLLLFALF